MKFPGTLEAGLRSGILTESKYIKGTYIVFQNADELYEFTNKYAYEYNQCKCNNALAEGNIGANLDNVLVPGAICFLVEGNSDELNTDENKYLGHSEYRWNGTSWDILDAPIDGKLYGKRNGKWGEITFDEAALNERFEEVSTQIDTINQILPTKQDNLINEGENQNIKTFYEQPILGQGDLQVPVATVDRLAGLKSGIDNREENIEYTAYPVIIDADTAVGSVNIPPLGSTTTASELINILEQGGELTLNGGSAPKQV